MSVNRRQASMAGMALLAGLWHPRPAASALSPEADGLLRAMSATLARARSLAVDLTVLREVRLADGRIATLHSEVGIAIRRPDRMRASIRGDAVQAEIFYDGRTLVVQAPLQRAYAQAEAPPNLDGALALLQDRLGVPVEIGDLLCADPYARLAEGTEGEIAAAALLSGRGAWHLMMKTGDSAWELWLDQGPEALPLMASIREEDRRLLLRFDEWRIGPTIADPLFAFSAAPGERRVPFAYRKPDGQP